MTSVESNHSASSMHHSQDYSNFKPGQKYPTPSPGNGDRVFYETLFSQRPSSEMAQEWCLNYGVLENKQAEKILGSLQSHKRKAGSNISPVKKATPSADTSPIKSKPKRK